MVEDHPWPMEIFEATPKAVRQPRPPRAERQAAAKDASPEQKKKVPAEQKPAAAAKPEKKPIPAVKAAPQAPEPAKLPRLEQARRETPPPRREKETPLPPPVQVASPVKVDPALLRRFRSDPGRRPGFVVAVADGRRKPDRDRRQTTPERRGGQSRGK